MLRKLGLHDLLLDQLIEDVKILGPTILGIAFHPCGVVLKGGDLGLELLIKLLQLFLFVKDVVMVEDHLLSFTI